VEAKSSLDSPWQLRGATTLTNSMGGFVEQPATNAQRFYRVTLP
jgi:hypothetical protein